MVEVDLSVGEEADRELRTGTPRRNHRAGTDVMESTAIGPLIVGHRGASAQAPENTLAAFRKAIEAGADGVEFDVRLARDGVPMVIHDRTLNRTGRLDAAVAELTSKDLSKVEVGSWFHTAVRSDGRATRSSEQVPTLSRTLASLADFRGLIFIELKCEEEPEVEPLTQAVCEVIKDLSIAPQIIVKSFRLAIIPHVRMLAPAVRTAALFAPKVMTILRKEKYLVNIAAEFGADELSIHYSLATRKLMEKAGKHDFPVHIWTADHPRWVKRAIRLGIRSIITNDPAGLLKRRAELLPDPSRTP